MSPEERKKYAAAVDKLLSNDAVRERFRENALDVVDSLGVELSERGVQRINRTLGLTDSNGVPAAAVPVVVVGVMVLSQIDDTPDFTTRDSD